MELPDDVIWQGASKKSFDGTKDLSIIGTDIYGNKVPIFIDGNFALEKIKKFIKERRDKNE